LKLVKFRMYQSGNLVVKIISTEGYLSTKEFPIIGIDMGFKMNRENWRDPFLYRYTIDGIAEKKDKDINYDLIDFNQ